jgi:two-component system cell cycle sensor histidine kinase/response regulator CckA
MTIEQPDASLGIDQDRVAGTRDDENELAQAQLRESEERFAKAFRSSPLAITISTLAEGRYVAVNVAFLQMLNRERGEVIGRTATELDVWAEPEDRHRLLQQLGESGMVKGLQARLRTSSGEIREANISAELIELEGFPCVLAITQDMTGTKRLEDQFRQAQKMEAVGRLAGGVAHDFNNMLGVIMGYTELSLQQIEPTHQLAGNLVQIKKTVDRAASLTRQLLAFSRQQILYPRVLDLNAVVNNVSEMLTRVIGEDVSLSFNPALPLGRIKADLGQVEHVLMNLAVNARDAMPTGGRIMIETANLELTESCMASKPPSMLPGRYVMLSVSDTGCGMDKKTMTHIFEPFFTTKGPGAGTGLGLSTVYGVVKQSGGYIWVYSEPGSGTTFKLHFPRTEESALPLPPVEDEPEPVVGSETILVVEDDEALRTLTVVLLETAGYKVLEAHNAHLAIKLVQKQKEPIHLLLADVIMPAMSGRELAERALEIQPSLKVLFMSGYAPELIARYGATKPGVAMIEKPFTRHSLLAKLKTILVSE